jgi:hypothetical protein
MGSAQRSSTARSALPSSPTSGLAHSSCWTRSVMRRLWVAAAWVSRSVARTRRSRAARAASGNRSGCSPAGSTSGRRARVSASMPLDLAWRDSTRRRSWALAELTRYTVWPRAVKNTAIGSHAGPVGSTTTSSSVPTGVSASAARSTCSRLSTVGIALQRHTRLPSPASTPTVWALMIPRSIPTSRRSSIWLPPWQREPAAPAAPMGGALRPRSQGRWVRRRHPLMCCNRPRPGPGRATSLIRGIRGRPRAAIRPTRLGAPAPSSEEDSTPPPEPAGMRMQPWDPGADQAPRSLT